jgi:tRNA 2-thiouridine synthesizing protein A
MAHHLLDATGLKCPQPILKIAVLSPDMRPGDILEVTGDCPTFEKDVRVWCDRLKKTLLMIREEDGYRKIIQIRF